MSIEGHDIHRGTIMGGSKSPRALRGPLSSLGKYLGTVATRVVSSTPRKCSGGAGYSRKLSSLPNSLKVHKLS